MGRALKLHWLVATKSILKRAPVAPAYCISACSADAQQLSAALRCAPGCSAVLTMHDACASQAEATEAEQPCATEHAARGQQQRGHAAARGGHTPEGGVSIYML